MLDLVAKIFTYIRIGYRRMAQGRKKRKYSWKGITFDSEEFDWRWIAYGIAIIALTPVAHWGTRLWEDWYCQQNGLCLTAASFFALLFLGGIGLLVLFGGLNPRISPK